MSEAATRDAIAARLEALRARIARAAQEAGRDPAGITLVGVSKRQPAPKLVAAVAAGLGHVAESFAQEARDKLPGVLETLAARGLPRPRLHFVGRLQTNKARLVAPLFDEVESVDREALADALDQRARALGRRLTVLLQVDLSDEPQKGGASPAETPRLLDHCRGLAGLEVRGLMAIPHPDADPSARRRSFAALRELRDALPGGVAGLPELSMGMSDDFPLAIAEGATRVRIGTALFGPRT